MWLTLIESIRINNFNDKQGMEKIQTMWADASRKLTQHEGVRYGVYYDYESDYKGDYSLGVAIEGDGTAALEIPNTIKYEVFKVDTSDEQGILNTWQQIWKLEEAGSLQRAYTHDLEKYDPSGNVEIHIAIK